MVNFTPESLALTSMTSQFGIAHFLLRDRSQLAQPSFCIGVEGK